MNDQAGKWDDFSELVTWATWKVIKGITSGEDLRSVLFNILRVAREAQFKASK